jgi:hypothetical protein
VGKFQMRNATPIGAEPLCRTCVHGLVLRGYRESEMAVRCTYANPAFAVSFTVSECTEFYDRSRPSWTAMEKLAIHVTPKGPSTPLGFKVGFNLREIDDDSCDEELEEVASDDDE